MWGILQAAGNPNAYDVTTWDPNVDQITFTSEAFFNDPYVKDALHVLNKDHYWHGCQAGSGRRRRLSAGHPMEHERIRKLYMNDDRPISVVPYIADLLDEGIPVVVYNGDRDMTTNMVGTELCLNAMEWSGQNEWLDAPRGLWKVDNYPAGWVKEYKNLTFAVVYNSGHMVRLGLWIRVIHFYVPCITYLTTYEPIMTLLRFLFIVYIRYPTIALTVPTIY